MGLRVCSGTVDGRFHAAAGQTGPVAGGMEGAVAATSFADPGWTAQVLARRARAQGTTDRRVLATVWWYSVSSVLLTPPLAGLVAGIPRSGRLADLSVTLAPGLLPVTAVAVGPGSGDLAADLRGSLASVVAAVAEAGDLRERPLWAIATDSLANRLLAVGQAVGDVDRATALAVPLAEAVGAPLPVPRYEDVGGRRFVRRGSCCLVDRTRWGATCTSCPHRRPEERRQLLQRLARPDGEAAEPG
ncbi:(2Fe-2S)-binding protein [Blastococcus haudaquaticus]|uniref:FhuF 2Fe-2S C-terminal domain-containing protein n=1 Tax=Blastococcus haudaquaticus TaxID=1938745 RepID=A0A286GYL5_9ACTN|nr:(2Fe-2S)-binding protein [Blastococcus haudaquaticus]SOE00618.1 FhuF 2Fe-2S C-terminal domain-containing protein [Blastococcus haudaquaticus]